MNQLHAPKSIEEISKTTQDAVNKRNRVFLVNKITVFLVVVAFSVLVLTYGYPLPMWMHFAIGGVLIISGIFMLFAEHRKNAELKRNKKAGLEDLMLLAPYTSIPEIEKYLHAVRHAFRRELIVLEVDMLIAFGERNGK